MIVNIIKLIWRNDIALWKIFWLSFAYYIVFAFAMLFLFNIFMKDLFIAQSSGHFQIYTFFLTSEEQNMFANDSVVDFAKKISPSFGSFYESSVNYSLRDPKNSTSVLFLAFLNLFSFLFWLWWCISLWLNSNNTNSSAASIVAKIFSVNGFLLPLYYFALSFMFFNAYVTQSYQYTFENTYLTDEESLIQRTMPDSDVRLKVLNASNFQLLIPENWDLYKRESNVIKYVHCIKKNECGYFIIKKVEGKSIFSKQEMRKWVEDLNPNYSIIEDAVIKHKKRDFNYIKFQTRYQRNNVEVIKMNFNQNNINFIMESISPINNTEYFFPIFNKVINEINIK